MSLAILMTTPVIITIAVVSFVVVACIVVGAILLHKHRFSSASTNLRKSYDEIHARLKSNCEVALTRLETLGNYSTYYQGIYADRKKQYQDIVDRKDKAILQSLESLDELVKNKEYRKVREIESEINNDIAAFSKSVSDFSSDLSTLLQEDDVTNSASVPVKTKHRRIETFYNEHKNELRGLEKPFECIISESKDKIEEFQLLTNEGKYAEARKLLDELDKLLTATVAIMDQLPLLEASVATVLPNKIEDLMKTYQEMIDEKYVIDYLKVPQKVDEMKKEIEGLKSQLEYLDITGVREKIDNIQSTITDLNAAFAEEKAAKVNFLSARNFMDDTTFQDEQYYSKLMKDLPSNQKIYQINEKYVSQMISLKTDIENIGILKRELDSYLDTSNRQPYTLIMKKISEMRTEMTKAERTMKDYQFYIDSLRKQVDDVYSGLRQLVVDIIKTRNAIRELGLNDFLSASDFRINRFLSEIKKINDMLFVLPMDVSSIVSLYNSLRDDANVFLSDSEKKLKDASRAEQSIVYANSYRVDYTDCDALVTEAENAYFEGGFTRAYSKACDANSSFNHALINQK